jgi:DNA polymerase-3 subunit delta'
VIELPEQPVAERVLRKALARPDPPQQLLVFGPPGTGKRELARRLAWELSAPGQEHSPGEVSLDIRAVAGTGAEIRREELEEAFAEIHARPMVHARRVLIIEEAERLRSRNAASLLLKTLEEPPPRSAIILVTDLVEDLLPTVRSRCVPVPFRFPGWEAVERRRPALSRELRELGVDLAAAVLGGERRHGAIVSDAQRRMEGLAAAAPSEELRRLRAEADEKAEAERRGDKKAARGLRTAERRAEDQAKREARRLVTDGWRDVLEGMSLLVRDVLARSLGAGGAVRLSEQAEGIAALAGRADPDALIAALDAIELRRAELALNPTNELAMEGLLAVVTGLLEGERPPLVAHGRLPFVAT